MPQIRKNRTWCKACQDWELFSVDIPANGEKSNPICNTCQSEYIPYSQDEVPEDKLVEQRERYNKMKFEEFKGMMRAYNMVAKVDTGGIFSGDADYDGVINEDDAGEIAIKEAKKAAREAKRLADIALVEKYRGVQRNSTCPCESGLKYKKCCLSTIEKLR